MPAKTPPCSKYPAWSEAKYRSFIRSALRQASIKWPPTQLAWKLVQRPSQLNDKRIKYEYQCDECKGWFKRSECENNHLVPTGVMMEGMDHRTIGDWVDRLLAPVRHYQILCKSCHQTLTNQQNAARRENDD